MASTFIIVYKNGETKDLEAQNKADLIAEYFEGSKEKFENEVKLLRWQQGTVSYTEDVEHGKIDEHIASADTNPYGWRNEVEEVGKPVEIEEKINEDLPYSTDKL
ncbi:hypothetical protein [Bernardetia sp.]|uniref:hypothetical protein n=1 Tax=Bernardetia sp. TaxID=1937974 RepID=UPI0025C0C404|nr:hypothetical protein [Bernardetia sp.]